MYQFLIKNTKHCLNKTITWLYYFLKSKKKKYIYILNKKIIIFISHVKNLIVILVFTLSNHCNIFYSIHLKESKCVPQKINK